VKAGLAIAGPVSTRGVLSTERTRNDQPIDDAILAVLAWHVKLALDLRRGTISE
jgi:hypothetical protein